MTTPNLDATGHQWVGALVKFNFQLEYQKGCNNTVADVLSWITTHLRLEAMQSILDEVALGATQRAERDNPAMIEGDHDIEKEVHVTTGQVLVEMHVTNWAAAQRGDPELDAVLHWLDAKKVNLRTLLGEHASSEEGRMVMEELSKFHGSPKCSLSALHPQRGVWGSTTLMVPKAHQTATLNGFHWDAGHQGHDCNLSLLQEHFWLPRMVKQMRQTIMACTHCLQY